jgi:hypothetical protein
MYFRDPGVIFDYKICLHDHVGYTLSRSIKMLGLVRTLTYFFLLLVGYYCYIAIQLDLHYIMPHLLE